MSDDLPPLPVLRTLGGCGGTLLTRLLGALPRTIVLSETNPRSASLFAFHLNPLHQLRKWRPALLEHVADFDAAELGDPERFGRMLQGVWMAAQAAGLRLIVRDFNYADFVGTPFQWPAARESSLDTALAGKFMPLSALLVRHPADQIASLRTHRALAQVLSAKRFVAGAESFLMAFPTARLFRYEALIEAPDVALRGVCDAIGVPFDAAALHAFATMKTVTGSFTRVAEDSISARNPSPEAKLARSELACVPGYAALCTRLGYPP